uniref:Uncharacterized protein n=1 Tax=Daphnia galeata TaxID=27404 RepID=A0A8J2WIS0_9CRUS|nr:unnamed protein product [Daphnia galeata]
MLEKDDKRNRVNERLQEYYPEVEKEDMSNLVDMPCKEKIRNIDDIPETCNEHLGCSQRQVTHQMERQIPRTTD